VISRTARSAALLLILRQLSAAKRAKTDDSCFFRSLFGAAFLSRHTPSQTRNARLGETTTSRRGLVHAYRFVIQIRREPALDLRDAHAASVTSLSVYGGWVR
jgi:hypothetical protein